MATQVKTETNGKNGSAAAKSASTALARIRSAGQLDPQRWSDSRIEAIQKMVAPEARSTHELAMFLGTAEKYGLDPLAGELWLGRLNGKPTVITGRDAYIKVAQRDPGYLGFDAGVIYEMDTYNVRREGAAVTVVHEYSGLDRGRIMGAYAVVYHADRRPVLVERRWDDYKHLHGRATWKQNGPDMILTRALTTALKYQFNLGGLYTAADGGTTPDEPWEEQPASGLADLERRMQGQADGTEPAADNVQEAEWEEVGDEDEPGVDLDAAEADAKAQAAAVRAQEEDAAAAAAEAEADDAPAEAASQEGGDGAPMLF